MLPEPDLHALLGARHPDPFAVLGQHADASGTLWQRALLPGATAVTLLDAASGKALMDLPQRHPDGFFEGQVPRRRQRFDYRLQVQWADGHQTVLADAYAHGPLLGEQDLHYLGEGSHLRPFEALGAHPLTLGQGPLAQAGTRFAVWAPNARRVSVVGNFNAWDGRRHPMRSRGSSGVWELFIPHVAPGDLYKYEILTRTDELLPLKTDPFGRASQLRPATASMVAQPLPPARPLPPGRAQANARSAPVSIYELHPGSWRRHPDDQRPQGRFYSWAELADSLPAYAASLGFTHLQLMPISEHPFDGSWGYQTLGLYAPSARFGPPEGFADFVQACHAQGLGLLLDWVPAHFPTDAHGLARFDGSALYEYEDPREGFHQDWNTLIFNFGRHEVKNFLVGSALYWIERQGVDGLRVDAVASMLYRDYSRQAGQWVPNQHGGRENLEAIALLKRTNEVIGAECPGAITVAEESTAFPGVSAPTFAGGLGFHYKWNMGWMNDTLRYMAREPVHRRWHQDELRFSLMYAFSENFVLPLSHDEVVHGKGSLLRKMPGDDWQRFANLRAYYGYLWGHPGKKLLFMGCELAPWEEWNDATGLPWHLLDHPPHAGVQRLVRDLNRVLRDFPALHQQDVSADGFRWIRHDDSDESVLAFERRARDGRVVLVICHFTPEVRHDYRLGVPLAGRWRELINTDLAVYGGSGVSSGELHTEPHPSDGHGQSLRLSLPPLATLMLVPDLPASPAPAAPAARHSDDDDDRED